MKVITPLTLDLLQLAKAQPAPTLAGVGLALGQLNATAMPRIGCTARTVLDFLRPLVQPADLLPLVRGFAEGAGPAAEGRPWLYVVEASAWLGVGRQGSFIGAELGNLPLSRTSRTEPAEAVRLLLTEEPRPPVPLLGSQVEEWRPPGPDWSLDGGGPDAGSALGYSVALVATVKDGGSREPSRYAFLFKQRGRL